MNFSERNDGAAFRLPEVFYLIFFAILLFAKGIGLYDGQKVFTVLLVIACLFWCGKVLLTKHTVGELLTMAVLLILGVLSWRISGEKAALVNIMVITGMKEVSSIRVFRIGAVIWTVCFIGTTTLATLGLIDDTILVHSKLGLGHIIRYSLGYTHPNVLHITYVILLAFLFYCLDLNRRQLIWASIAAFVLNFYIFLYSISYTGFVMAALFLMLNLYFRLRSSFTRKEKILIQCVFPLCAIISVLGPVLIQGSLFDFMNRLMNTRWEMSRYFLTEQTIGLFGTSFTDLPDTSYSIDCSYVYVLMYYGIILFILACIACFRTVHYEVRREGRRELPILLTFFVGGMIEPFMANFSFKNLTLIFLGECMYAVPLFHFRGAFGEFWNRPVQLTPWTEMTVTLPGDGRKTTPAGPNNVSPVSSDPDRAAGAGSEKRSCTIQRWVKSLRGRGRILLLVGLLAGVISGVVFFLVTEPMDSVYVDVWKSDLYYTNGEMIQVKPNEEELPEDWNGMIIGTADGKTNMYEITGNIVIMEHVRDAVSLGLAIGVLAAAAAAVGFIAAGKGRGDGSC